MDSADAVSVARLLDYRRAKQSISQCPWDQLQGTGGNISYSFLLLR